MDPSRLAELEELFEQVMALPVEDRAVAIDQLSDDEELQDALRLLIESSDDAASYFDSLGGRIAEGMSAELDRYEAEDQGLAGERFGRYEVVREIGSGGMGRVYLARSLDGHVPEGPEVEVAIKVLRSELVKPDVVARFSVETSFLAGIAHPNIARLIDAGTRPARKGAAEEQPYFVMEYVDGQPIDRFCDDNHLGLRERLLLFRKLCDAVHFLHQNLVVHRDIKPGNVMVSGDGEPKLLDFGIAKFLDPSGMRWKGDETRGDVRLFTPDYASPEQILGETITTATDVFSLGALLYLLLTGKRIRSLESGSYPDLVRAVTDGEPERPSTAVSRSVNEVGSSSKESWAAWQKHLVGDLDAILLKALRREPEHRYATAAELSEELRRYLEGEPVQARRGGVAYRVRKFIRRHRLAVAALVLTAAAIVVAFAGVTLGLREARRAQAEAQREAATSARVTDFLVETFRVSNPSESLGETVTARELLDRGAERIRSELQEEPVIRVRLLRTLGSVYRELGLLEDASVLLEEALEERRVLPSSFDSPSNDQAVDLLNDMARLRWDQGNYPEALDLYRLALTESKAATNPDEKRIARLEFSIGVAEWANGDAAGAEATLTAAVERMRESYGADHVEVAQALSSFGGLLYQLDRLELAEQTLEESVELFAAQVDALDPRFVMARNNLGNVLMDLGRHEQAQTLFRELLESEIKVLGEQHPDVALTIASLAVSLKRSGSLEEAKLLYEQALAIERSAYGDDHPEVAATRANLASLLGQLGQFEESLVQARESLEIAEAAFGKDHLRVALPLELVGRAEYELGDTASAGRRFERSLAIRRASLPPDSPLVVQALELLVDYYEETSAPAKATALRAELEEIATGRAE